MRIHRRTTSIGAGRRRSHTRAAWWLRLLHRLWGPPWGDVPERADRIPTHRAARLDALMLSRLNGMP